MKIRESKNADLVSIRKLHEDAFGEPEGKIVAQLAIDLLADKTAMPLLSLLAEDDNKIIGHIIFSTVRIKGNKKISIYILAPLAVSTDQQRKGIGTNLINFGLAKLKQQGADIVLVLGYPDDYKRSGFHTRHRIKPPYTLEYPEAWMALELNSGVLLKAEGIAQCGVSLNSPEHW